MVGIRFADLRSHPTEFLDFISVTLDEFPQLVPPFEAVFQARMAAWRMCTCSHDTGSSAGFVLGSKTTTNQVYF